MDFIDEKLKILNELKDILHCSDKEIIQKVETVILNNKKLENRLNRYQADNNKEIIEEILSKLTSDQELSLIIERIDNISDLKQLGDLFRDKINKKGIIVIGTIIDNKPSVMSAVTDDIIDKINAIEIVQHIGKIINGGGGGKSILATAGGKDKSKLDQSLIEVRKFIKGKVVNE